MLPPESSLSNLLASTFTYQLFVEGPSLYRIRVHIVPNNFFCSYITVPQYYTQLNVKHGEGKVILGEIRGSLFLVVNYNNYF